MPVVLLAAGLVAFFALGLDRYLSFEALRENRTALMHFVADHMTPAILLYIVAYALLVAISVPGASVLTVAGGFLFGLPLGVFYSTVGLTLGSAVAFTLGRWLERTYLRHLIDPDKLEQFRQIMKREGALAAFIIFLIPGVPKDFLSYVLGFSTLSLKFFLVAVAIFRLPSTILLNLQGVEVAHGHYWLSVGIIGFNYLLALLIYRHREYVYRWIKAWHLKEL